MVGGGVQGKGLHKEAFIVLLGQLAGALGTMVGVKVLTTFLEPKVYGLVALGMSAVNLFLYQIGTPVRSTATRFFSLATGSGRLSEYEGVLGRIGWIVSTVLMLAAAGLFLAGLAFYALVVVLSLLLSVDAVFNGVQTGARNRGVVALLQSLVAWSRFLCAAGLLLWFGRGSVELVFAGFCLSALANIVLQAYFYRRTIRFCEPVEHRATDGFSARQFYTYLWPLAATGLVSWGQLHIDRWGLTAFASLEDVGIYFALYQISYAPVLLLYSCVYYFVSPILFEHAGDAGDAARMKRVYTYVEIFAAATLLLSVALAGMMWLAHGLVGRLLLNPGYADHSGLLPLLVLSGGVFAAGTQLLLSVQSGMDLKPLLFQRTFSFGSAVLCYLLGTYWFGLAGAVAGGLVFAFTYAGIAFAFHFRLRRRGGCLPGAGGGE